MKNRIDWIFFDCFNTLLAEPRVDDRFPYLTPSADLPVRYGFYGSLLADLGAEVAASPHIAAREMLFKAVHPVLGDIPLVRQPVRFSGASRGDESPPPVLGEHTRALLAALLGLADSEIDALAREGII